MSEISFLPIKEFEAQNITGLPVEFEGLDENALDVKSIIREAFSKRKCIDGDTASYYLELILEGMGMEKYVSLFKSYDITLDVFLQLNSEDLIALGIDDEDHDCFLQNLTQYNFGHDAVKNTEVGTDDLIMARNVLNHIIQLNSYVACIYYQLKKNKLEDCFITHQDTALDFLKLVTKQSIVQSQRISAILFDGNFYGDNLVASALKGLDMELPDFMKKKLKGNMQRKLKKDRVFFTIAAVSAGICIVFLAITIHKK